MRKTIKYMLIASFLISPLLVGCGAQYRQAAMDANREAQRINTEAVSDLYNIAIKQAVGLIKARLRADKESLDQVVEVTDKSGNTHRVSKMDAIINQGIQAVVDAGWLKENTAVARGLNDLSWVYMASRESFLEVFKRDVEAAIKGADTSTSQPVQ